MSQVVGWGADGVIVGSAMVKVLNEAKSPEEGLKELEVFTKSLKAALEWEYLLCYKFKLVVTLVVNFDMHQNRIRIHFCLVLWHDYNFKKIPSFLRIGFHLHQNNCTNWE